MRNIRILSIPLLLVLLAVGSGCKVDDASIISQAADVHKGLQPAVMTDPQLANYLQNCGNRIIAAANRDMRAEAGAGRFREDLLYRLDVIRIHIPPLRDRPDDIPLLAEHCWKTATARTGSRPRLSPATLTQLSR